MKFSINDSVPFSKIDWSTLENRPYIDRQHHCTEKNWYDNVPCCMDGYTVEHVNDLAQENGLQDTSEAKFLNQYPCVNGVESDYFYEKFTGQKAPTKAEADSFYSKIFGPEETSEKSEESSGFFSGIWNGIKDLFS